MRCRSNVECQAPSTRWRNGLTVFAFVLGAHRKRTPLPVLADVVHRNIPMRELPPGQVETRRFPVVGELAPSASMPAENWRLIVEGEVESPLELTYPDVLAMPQGDLVMNVHCVTGWTRFETAFTSVPLAELLSRAKLSGRARFVRFVAYSDRKHDISLPLDVATEDCWLVHQVDGQPLTREHGARCES